MVTLNEAGVSLAGSCLQTGLFVKVDRGSSIVKYSFAASWSIYNNLNICDRYFRFLEFQKSRLRGFLLTTCDEDVRWWKARVLPGWADAAERPGFSIVESLFISIYYARGGKSCAHMFEFRRRVFELWRQIFEFRRQSLKTSHSASVSAVKNCAIPWLMVGPFFLSWDPYQFVLTKKMWGQSGKNLLGNREIAVEWAVGCGLATHWSSPKVREHTIMDASFPTFCWIFGFFFKGLGLIISSNFSTQV